MPRRPHAAARPRQCAPRPRARPARSQPPFEARLTAERRARLQSRIGRAQEAPQKSQNDMSGMTMWTGSHLARGCQWAGQSQGVRLLHIERPAQCPPGRGLAGAAPAGRAACRPRRRGCRPRPARSAGSAARTRRAAAPRAAPRARPPPQTPAGRQCQRGGAAAEDGARTTGSPTERLTEVSQGSSCQASICDTS